MTLRLTDAIQSLHKTTFTEKLNRIKAEHLKEIEDLQKEF